MPTARSRHQSSIGRGYLGKYPKPLWLVIERAWELGISVSSNFARDYAPLIALAASLGWISTVTLDGKKFTNRWNVTAEGVTALNHIRRGRTRRCS